MSDGCEQRERFPAALAEGYFRVDETSLAERVASTAALASHLKFVDLEQREAGHWGEMFHSDEGLVIARIAAVNLKAGQESFLRDADSAPLPTLALRVTQLAGQVDAWLKALSASDEAAAKRLGARIRQLVAQPLADDLHWVLDRAQTHRWPGLDIARIRSQFDPVWLATRTLHVVPVQRGDRDGLRARFFSIVSAMGRIQDLARELLPQSLNSQTHPPGSGLLMAFLQLFGAAQHSINRFTGRHADFYYDDCLRMVPLPATADGVHLVLARDPRSTDDLVIARGSVFTAGKDAAGRRVDFRADDELILTDARVVALHSLRLHRDPLISPEREFGYVTRAEARRLPWPHPAAATPDKPLPRWQLFGGGVLSSNAAGLAQGPADDPDARIGLALSSPLLFLREGQRTIELTLTLSHSVDSDSHLQRLAQRARSSASAARRLLPILFKRYLLLAPQLLSAQERLDIGPVAVRLARQVIERWARVDAEPEQPKPRRQTPTLRAGVDANEAAQVEPLLLDGPDCYDAFIAELTFAAPTQALFFDRLGRFFSRWLLSAKDKLSDEWLSELRDTARRLDVTTDQAAPVAGDPLCLMLGPHRPERELIFGDIFNSLFNLSLTAADGWMPLSDVFVVAAEVGAGNALSGLRLVIRLRPEDPPIVGCSAGLHGNEWQTRLPVLRVIFRRHGRLYPYSLLDDFLLAEAHLTVRVKGLREVILHNQIGPLDPTKPFLPFGPLPTTSSYLVLGAPEIARKNVTRLRVNIEWSALTGEVGGFGRYYAGYGVPLQNESFTVAASILRGGQWHSASAPNALALFKTSSSQGRLQAWSRIEFDESDLRMHSRASQEALTFDMAARSGFYRLVLNGPAMAFGHQAYPGLLTEVLSANTMNRRRRPQALPNPPYTPLIERIGLDYEAQSHLSLNRDDLVPAGDEVERIDHLHPFGSEPIYPSGLGSLPALMPRFAHAGGLFIGISATEMQGRLTLHFHLRDEDARAWLSGRPRPGLHWAYLASNRWHALSTIQVVSDTTGGLLTSGIVTLDLPAGLDRLSTIMPADCYWLRVSADSDFESFAGLYGVRCQSLRATRVIADAGTAPITALAAGSVKEALVSIPGLAAVEQVGPSFGLRSAEDRARMQTRVGERLQHRQRATTAWDYERLVLEQFPAVQKVKCFVHRSERNPTVSPGEVLIVVLPTPKAIAAQRDQANVSAAGVSATAAPQLNAIELRRIQDFLRGLSSPFAQIQVRNAVYERIQVRCAVKFARSEAPGQSLQRVNRAIVDFLSPWFPGSGYTPTFDWTVRCEDVEAHLRAMAEIDFVTRLSLLRIAQGDNGVYSLNDTARSRTGLIVTQLRPLSPWSIALPMREHLISAVDAVANNSPEATGIADLAIANTFIVGRTLT
jgi:hypothetical protein